jgi:sec-independent protein translocase protein TatA
MFGIGPQEMIVVGVIAVLLFGKRLPEVARSMGKSFVEFKKGISGVEDEIHNAGRARDSYAPHQDAIEDHEEASAPKFEPPKTAPQAEEQKA